MDITLKLVSYQRLTPGQQESYNFELNRFSIGRNPDNDLSLPDPQRFLSDFHCWLEIRDGIWRITDASVNGVFINGSENRLSQNEAVDLNAGDKFRIGDYEFEVTMNDGSLAGNPLTGNEEAMVGADPFADPFESADTPSASEPFFRGHPV